MRIDWKRVVLITADMALGVYLFLAVTSFNKVDDTKRVCTKVNINIDDARPTGFIDAKEIKARLEQLGLYPIDKPLSQVRARQIEDCLKASPFVKSA